MAEAYLSDTIKKRFGLTRDDIATYKKLVRSYQHGAADPANSRESSAPVEFSADFPGLVDLVEHEGQPAFLVKNGQSGKCEIVLRHTHDGHTYAPPPAEQLPFRLPSAQAVIEALEQAGETGSHAVDGRLYDDLVLYFKGISELPSEEHYHLLAVFALHTYLWKEQFEYSPYLCFFADPEKGKTRTAKACIYVVYRGVHIESLREASIIRYAQNLKACLVFDVKDLWRKAEAQGSEDILLLRFERGAKVARVLFPDRGAFQDTVYYDIFGPTIIATNEAVDRILETRAISITMPETSRAFENDVTPDLALPLKARMLAFRARYMDAPLPAIDKPARGRLGDILRPLLQVMVLVKPEHISRFRVLVKHLQAARMVEKAETLEAKVIGAVTDSEPSVGNGILSVQAILNILNIGRSEKYSYRAETVGRRLKSLGFAKARTGDGHAAIVWDNDLVERLCVKYGVHTSEKPSEPSEPSELTPVQWPDAGVTKTNSKRAAEGSDRTEGSEGSTQPYKVNPHTHRHTNGNGHNPECEPGSAHEEPITVEV